MGDARVIVGVNVCVDDVCWTLTTVVVGIGLWLPQAASQQEYATRTYFQGRCSARPQDIKAATQSKINFLVLNLTGFQNSKLTSSNICSRYAT
jgi:hypothetical protein